jgi:hypothetical protein
MHRKRFWLLWLPSLVMLFLLFVLSPNLVMVVLLLFHLLIFFPLYVRAKIKDLARKQTQE